VGKTRVGLQAPISQTLSISRHDYRCSAKSGTLTMAHKWPAFLYDQVFSGFALQLKPTFKYIRMTSSHQITPARLSSGRSFASILGYLLMLAGTLSIFRIPFYLSFLLITAGAAIGWLAHCPMPVMTWYSWLILIGGCVVIFSVLSAFGTERIRHWSPHPAGYIPTWFMAFHIVRQIRYMFSRYSATLP
jgi:hypothetical protein